MNLFLTARACPSPYGALSKIWFWGPHLRWYDWVLSIGQFCTAAAMLITSHQCQPGIFLPFYGFDLKLWQMQLHEWFGVDFHSNIQNDSVQSGILNGCKSFTLQHIINIMYLLYQQMNCKWKWIKSDAFGRHWLRMQRPLGTKSWRPWCNAPLNPSLPYPSTTIHTHTHTHNVLYCIATNATVKSLHITICFKTPTVYTEFTHQSCAHWLSLWSQPEWMTTSVDIICHTRFTQHICSNTFLTHTSLPALKKWFWFFSDRHTNSDCIGRPISDSNVLYVM